MDPQAQAGACQCPAKSPTFDDDIGLFTRVFALQLILAFPTSIVVFFLLKSVRAVLDPLLLYASPEPVRSKVMLQSREEAEKAARLWSNELCIAYGLINIAWALWYPNPGYFKPLLVILGMMLLVNLASFSAALATILFRRLSSAYGSTPATPTKDGPQLPQSGDNLRHAEKETAAASPPPPDTISPCATSTQLEQDMDAARTIEVEFPEPHNAPNAGNGNRALQDYHFQLALLEEQNKKRLLMAKQVQDEMIAQ
ncbi:MAG: hypothetical protein Q9191_001366 [Dirinaria sp. TL-2023a]